MLVGASSEMLLLSLAATSLLEAVFRENYEHVIMVNVAQEKAQTAFFGNVLLARVDTPTENAQSHAQFLVCTRSTAKFSFYLDCGPCTDPT